MRRDRDGELVVLLGILRVSPPVITHIVRDPLSRVGVKEGKEGGRMEGKKEGKDRGRKRTLEGRKKKG